MIAMRNGESNERGGSGADWKRSDAYSRKEMLESKAGALWIIVYGLTSILEGDYGKDSERCTHS